MMKHTAALMLTLSLFFCLGDKVQAATYTRSEQALGTTFKIITHVKGELSPARQTALFEPLLATLRDYDTDLNPHHPRSVLTGWVRAFRAGEPDASRIPDRVCNALIRSSFYHAMTQGAFDPTAGTIAALRFDAAVCLATELPPGPIPFDFGSLANGMAIDAAIADFAKQPPPAVTGLAIVAAGSSAYFWGTPVDTPGWPMPTGAGKDLPAPFRLLKHQALAVASTAAKQGEIYVLSDGAAEASALATALTGLRPAQRRQLAQRFSFRFWQAPSRALPSSAAGS